MFVERRPQSISPAVLRYLSVDPGDEFMSVKVRWKFYTSENNTDR